jgi:hypothetical protein
VAFTVSIPASTISASHYAGIVAIDAADLAAAAAAGKKSTKTTFTISRINRQALPITIRMPGPQTRSVTLSSVKLTVDPVATLMLGLVPGGTVLIQNATINLQVLRGTRTIFTYKSTLGHLFPNTSLNYRVPWQGTPTAGTYHVIGVFRPKGAAAVNIDTNAKFTGANAAQLKRQTPPLAGARASSTGLPIWVWLALGLAALLLIALLVTVYRLSRRPPAAVA